MLAKARIQISEVGNGLSCDGLLSDSAVKPQCRRRSVKAFTVIRIDQKVMKRTDTKTKAKAARKWVAIVWFMDRNTCSRPRRSAGLGFGQIFSIKQGGPTGFSGLT